MSAERIRFVVYACFLNRLLLLSILESNQSETSTTNTTESGWEESIASDYDTTNNAVTTSTGMELDEQTSSNSSGNVSASGGHSNCNHTTLMDILEMQKLDILMRLGFKQLPHASKENLTEEELRHILWQFKQSEEAIKDQTSNTILFRDENPLAVQFYSYTDNGYRPPVMALARGRKFVYFEMNIYQPHEANKRTIVNAATMKLYKSYVKPEPIMSSDFVDKSVRINVLQIVNDSFETARRTVASRLVSLENIGWEEFDVTKSIREWLSEPASNFGFEIDCDEPNVMDELIHFVTWNDTAWREVAPGAESGASSSSSSSESEKEEKEEEEEKEKDKEKDSERFDKSQMLWPILNVVTRSIELQKPELKKRSAEWMPPNFHPPSDPSSDNDDCKNFGCCSRIYNVSYEDIGWHWVIHPKNITLSACSGSCDRARGSLARGCLPSRLDGLSIVHFDDRFNVLFSFLPGVVPFDCRCSGVSNRL